MADAARAFGALELRAHTLGRSRNSQVLTVGSNPAFYATDDAGMMTNMSMASHDRWNGEQLCQRELERNANRNKIYQGGELDTSISAAAKAAEMVERDALDAIQKK